jgi:hypothetical protein
MEGWVFKASNLFSRSIPTFQYSIIPFIQYSKKSWYRSKVFPWGTVFGKGWPFFFLSEAPGLVFSGTYLRGKLAPSAFPSKGSGLRLPPQISHEKHGGLPPVTSEKAPALSFIKPRFGDHFASLCKHF